MQPRPIFLISVTPANDPDVIHLPLQQIRYLHPAIDFEAYDALVLTSKHAVTALNCIASDWQKLPVLCVGSATGAAASTAGAQVLEVAGGYGDALFEIISTRYAKHRWLYVRPRKVASDFAGRLQEANIQISESIVYETVCDPEPVLPQLPGNAVIIFTSPSACDCFQRHYALSPSQAVVAIGQTTRQAIVREASVHVALEPTVASCIALAKML